MNAKWTAIDVARHEVARADSALREYAGHMPMAKATEALDRLARLVESSARVRAAFIAMSAANRPVAMLRCRQECEEAIVADAEALAAVLGEEG